MSDGGYTDLGFNFDDLTNTGGYTDLSTQDLPGVDYSNFTYADAVSQGWSETDWTDFLSKIGPIAASTYNAIAHPGYPSAYGAPAPVGSGASSGSEASLPASGFSFASLTDFSTPYPYVAIAGVVLLIVVLKKK